LERWESVAKIVAVDLDDTVCTGDVDRNECLPIEGAVVALRNLTEMGAEIWYYTSRSWHRLEQTRAWLRKYGFPNPDQVVCGKVGAAVYIGNEAVAYRGDWGAAAADALELLEA
jgi:hypothetical protein